MKNRSLLMIPGPIEFDPAVLSAMGAPTTGHLAPNFIEAFGQALERTRTFSSVQRVNRLCWPEPALWVWIRPAPTWLNPGMLLW